MNLTRLSVLVLFILVIISCNFVSASDLSFDDNYSKSELDVVEIDSDNIPIKQIDEVVLEIPQIVTVLQVMILLYMLGLILLKMGMEPKKILLQHLN